MSFVLSNILRNASALQFIISGGLIILSLVVYNIRLNRKRSRAPRLFPRCVGKAAGTLVRIDNFEVVEKRKLNHDSYIISLRFPANKSNHVLGVPISQHVVVHAPHPLKGVTDPALWSWNGAPIPSVPPEVQRPYTPLTGDERPGVLQLLVKVYGPNSVTSEGVVRKDGGLMSHSLERLGVGDMLSLSGPKGKIRYLGNGSFVKLDKKINGDTLYMIMAGTGICPGYQLIQHILSHSNDEYTRIKLLFANKTEEDILLLNELEEFAEHYPSRFEVVHILSRESPREFSCPSTIHTETENSAGTCFNQQTDKKIDGENPVRKTAGMKSYRGLKINEDIIRTEVVEDSVRRQRQNNNNRRRGISLVESMSQLFKKKNQNAKYFNNGLILVCGPFGFVYSTILPILKKCDFVDEQIIVF